MNSVYNRAPPKPTIKVNFGDKNNFVEGNLLLDSGASRSMVHVKLLEKANFVVSSQKRQNGYVGAGSNKLILASLQFFEEDSTEYDIDITMDIKHD